MGFIELIEVGLFTAFWNFYNLYLSIAVYFCVIIGFLIQSFLNKRKNNWKWSLIIIEVVGIFISECAWHAITGWDRIAVDLVYGLLVCLLLGTVISLLVHLWKNRNKK